MRTIPRAYADGQQPPSMVVPSVIPVSDVDPSMLSDASGQRGVSSLIGMPVQIPAQRPTMDPADANAELGYARQAQVAPQQNFYAPEAQQPVPQAAFQQQVFEPQPQPQFQQPQAQQMPTPPVEPQVSANWRVICQGVVDHAELNSGGASVIVRSNDGRRFAAYIKDVPVIEVGILVELGVRSERNTRTDEETTVADIIRIPAT